MTQITHFLAPLDDLAVLRIDGPDAADFLHSQLSNDIAGIGPGDARLNAYCNPKGRMLGTLVVWKQSAEPDSAFLALVKADVVESLLKRLRMFVLRAKVQFDATAFKVYGASFSPQPAAAAVQGPVADAAGGATAAALPAWPPAAAAWQVVRDAAGITRISAPPVPQGPARWWVVVEPQANTAALAASLGLAALDNAAAWHAQDIAAGLGWVEQANVELFIPQSLGYDLIGGVSFTKGCYPGQEVVARAHFRGTVKRRAIPGQCRLQNDLALAAGADIFDAGNPRSPAGRIVNTAPAGTGGNDSNDWHVLMEVSLTDIGQADFRGLSPAGPPIRLLALPYPLEHREDA